jgi:hypothetical protein
MPIVACPACGEEDDLAGAPDGDRIMITCGACGATWDRDTTPTCKLCGSTDLEAVRTSTLQEKGRGDQWAPSGIRLVYYCWSCTGHDVTSNHPIPGPNPPPGAVGDLRDLRNREG